MMNKFKHILVLLLFVPTLVQAAVARSNSSNAISYAYDLNNNPKQIYFIFGGGYAQASVASSTTDNFAFYYYNQDHLGNIREVVNASDSVQQVTNYYPFGAPYADTSAATNADFQPYKYNGKELDKMHGLNTYDYGARQHDPILARWDRIDPLCEKYYSVSPYAYCLNNPLAYVDPDGRKVYGDSVSQEIIRNTLSEEESKYVEFDSNGQLNYELLCQFDGNSANMEALKLLAKSDVDYSFESKECDSEGNCFFESKNNYYRGVTEMPGANTHPSFDGKVHIITGSMLSKEQQAKTLTHEGYGHGVIYELTKDPDAASHHYKNKRGDSYMYNGVEYFDLIRYDSNEILDNQINRVISETIRNINNKKYKND